MAYLQTKRKFDDATDSTNSCALCTNYEPTLSVTKYPIVAKKKAPKDQTVITAIVKVLEEDGYKYLLLQRPPSGLLASFWEFPSVIVDDRLEYRDQKIKMDQFLKDIGLTVEKVTERRHLGEIQHIFTHVKQMILLEEFSISKMVQPNPEKVENSKWVTETEFSGLAVSKGTKKCMDASRRQLRPQKPPRKSQKLENGKAQPRLDQFFTKNK